MLKEFKEFIARGNVIDLAVGVIMGAAFGKIVTTLVEGVLMPPFGLLLGQLDFSSMLYVLDSPTGEIPTSLTDAKAKGVPVIAYGQFINDVIAFLIMAAVVFLLVKQVNRLKRIGEQLLPDAPLPLTTKECPFCTSAIPIRATRCPHCTSAV
jgi:large conductance mechanosensitive channel